MAASAEARIVQDATDFDPVTAARLARYVVSRIDSDGADARDGERLAQAEQKAARNNELGSHPDGDGGGLLRGRLDADGQVIVDAARHWACDTGLIAAVLDVHSRPVDITDEKRLFDGRLRRALEIRDGGCTFPGCDRPDFLVRGHRCAIAHIGPTNQ